MYRILSFSRWSKTVVLGLEILNFQSYQRRMWRQCTEPVLLHGPMAGIVIQQDWLNYSNLLGDQKCKCKPPRTAQCSILFPDLYSERECGVCVSVNNSSWSGSNEWMNEWMNDDDDSSVKSQLTPKVLKKNFKTNVTGGKIISDCISNHDHTGTCTMVGDTHAHP